MKILNIAMKSPFTEGYTYQDNLLPEYQHKLGHEVTFLTGTRTRDEGGHIITIAPEKRILVNGVKLIRISSGNKFRQFIGYYPQISKIIKQENPDLIFVHSLASFVPVQAISYKKKKNKVILVADNHQDEGTTNVTGFFFVLMLSIWRFCWKIWINSFSHIYGVTGWRGDFAEKYYGIPTEKIDTLVMGLDADSLPKDFAKVRKGVRDSLSFAEDDFVFVTGGKFDSRKRTIETIRSFCNCKNDNIRLLLFGSVGDDIKEDFELLVKNDNRIKYIGYINSRDAHKYFIASDFGLFPGRHSVLWEEAIGCELPCIFRKYCDHDHTQVCDNCIQVASDISVEDLSVILKRIVSDKEFYQILKINAIKAAPKFSYYDIAEKSVHTID